MRKEPYSIDSYVHVIKRGSRGLPIVRDDSDRWRFLLMLFHFNDTFSSDNWFRDLIDFECVNSFKRPSIWPDQEKIVKILCFCLVENHFHLLLKEITDGGIAKFMQRIGIGMAKSFNEKYKEKGTLFQSSYRSKTVTDDVYLQYVSAYIQVKNCFELYPHGGYVGASQNFEKAFEWATKYPYCSLIDFSGVRTPSIIESEILSDLFTQIDYKSFAKDFISGRTSTAPNVALE